MATKIVYEFIHQNTYSLILGQSIKKWFKLKIIEDGN